jgi:hypothetical protein
MNQDIFCLHKSPGLSSGVLSGGSEGEGQSGLIARDNKEIHLDQHRGQSLPQHRAVGLIDMFSFDQHRPQPLHYSEGG